MREATTRGHTTLGNAIAVVFRRRRGRVPAGAGAPARRGRPDPDAGAGGASVREPRRPAPTPPGLSAERREPGRAPLVDLTER